MFAFLCHYRLSGQMNPCFYPMVERLPEKLNGEGYFGPRYSQTGQFNEFQLGGHNWYLRALCTAYELFGEEKYLQLAKQAFEGLFLPTIGAFHAYPVNHGGFDGDIHGSALIVGKWLLCSDIGAAFMSIDGLSHYYVTTKDERTLALLTEMIAVFAGIDILRLKTQAHATLCAARGILRLYEETKEERLFSLAQKIWCLYQKHALTLTYQNLNWFSKGETWTEPCAIVDSLILALHLYALGGREEDLMLARRIWHNGMASAQRPNGGAGTDTCVTANVPVLHSDMYEAFFCCTMRLSEGFVWAKRYESLLAIPLTGKVERDEQGRYFDGDLLYAEIVGGNAVVDEALSHTVNGRVLTPLLKYYLQEEEGLSNLCQKIVF